MDDQTNKGEPSLTIGKFCDLEDISLPTYHKMRNAGNGPREMRVPGTAIVRISAEARREWHEKIKKLADSPEVLKIRRQLSEHGKRAGNVARKSAKHISRQRKKQAAR